MSGLTNFRGLQVMSPDPTGSGGLAINDDFKELVSWNPKSKWDADRVPSVDDDVTDDYQPGSNWFSPQHGLFICADSSTGAAQWLGANVGQMGLTTIATTDDDTPEELLLGSATPITVPENSSWGYTITAIARRTDTGSDSAIWEIKGAVKRETSAASIIQSNLSTIWMDAGPIADGWDLAVAVANTSELQILATGATGRTIEWLANVRIVLLAV